MRQSTRPWPPMKRGVSLLETETIRLTGAASTASLATARTVTGTSSWLGGQRRAGEAVRLWTIGAVVSRTVTVNVAEAALPAKSVAVATTVVVPTGNTLPGGGV